MRRFSHLVVFLLTLAAFAHQTPAKGQESTTSQTLAASAADQRFTLILFWKQNDAASQAMTEELKAAAVAYPDRTAITAVNLADPAEQDTVKRLGVSRAPMPMVLVVAPNGAVTGRFLAKMNADALGKALVTPTMCLCMRALQDGKIVVVCGQPNGTTPIPTGVRNLHADTAFQSRTVVVSFAIPDPAEARFLQDLKLEPKEQNGFVAMLAPPGVMVGKFSASVTKEELATKLHAAGKCCEDENCKHHKKGAK